MLKKTLIILTMILVLLSGCTKKDELTTVEPVEPVQTNIVALHIDTDNNVEEGVNEQESIEETPSLQQTLPPSQTPEPKTQQPELKSETPLPEVKNTPPLPEVKDTSAPPEIKNTPNLPETKNIPEPPSSSEPELKPSVTPSVEEKEVTAKEEILNRQVIKLSISGIDNKQVIMAEEEIEFSEGDTVFDVLLSTTKSRKIQMEFSGGKNNAYIKGIDNLYEFDKGEGSGWLFSINGEFADRSASHYKLKKGDVIAWRYTKDLGRDLGVKGF